VQSVAGIPSNQRPGHTRRRWKGGTFRGILPRTQGVPHATHRVARISVAPEELHGGSIPVRRQVLRMVVVVRPLCHPFFRGLLGFKKAPASSLRAGWREGTPVAVGVIRFRLPSFDRPRFRSLYSQQLAADGGCLSRKLLVVPGICWHPDPQQKRNIVSWTQGEHIFRQTRMSLRSSSLPRDAERIQCKLPRC
jgi:hypothetical protein